MSLVEAENDRFKQAIEFILTIVECQKKATAKRWYDKEGYAQMVPVLLARMMMGLGARDGEEAGEALQDWIEETDVSLRRRLVVVEGGKMVIDRRDMI
jgi:hypothetical protein